MIARLKVREDETGQTLTLPPASLIAVLVPLGVYLSNGEVGTEFVVLGAVLGFAYWFWWTPTI